MISVDKIKKIKNNKKGFFRFKKFDSESFLITNDIGKYAFLTNDEFEDFVCWKIDSWDKYKELLEKKFIVDLDYEKEMSKAFLQKNWFLAYGPSLHIVVVTKRCNHQCIYCHASACSKDLINMDMTQEISTGVVDAIFYTSSPNVTIEFQWWEPLLNFDIVKYIIEYAKGKAFYLKKNVSFTIVTNLTLMTEEILNYLLENNVWISTSLDWNEEIHNNNRIFREWNSFKEVTYWINRINSEYEKRWSRNKIWALLTVTKDSLSRYKEIIDTYIDLWLRGVFIRPLNPYWFAFNDLEKLSYKIEDFLDFYNKSMDYIIEINKKWIQFIEMLSNIYLYKILTPSDPNYMDERSPCGACIWQVAYDYNGKIYSCDEWRMLARMWDDNFLMSELKENWSDTYSSMMDSETTKIMVQASTLDWLPWYNDSVYKPYLWVCPIFSYKTSWNIFSNYINNDKRIFDYKVFDYLFDKLRDNETKDIFEKWITN